MEALKLISGIRLVSPGSLFLGLFPMVPVSVTTGGVK